MGTILSESYETTDEGRASPESRGSPGAAVSWDEHPERVGVTFNLSKQLATELERIRSELRSEGDSRPSRSEVAESALRIVVEDARERGDESELSRRLRGRRAERDAERSANPAGTTRRSVDESGVILETVHDENGEIVDENVVANVADLPVVEEYVDDRGRLVSLAEDELGNTFEQIMDDELNALGTRLL